MAVGCESPTAPDPLEIPSPKGTPTGAAVVRSIGPSGGSLTSGDGVLTLVVPASAVTTATDFSIQPITGPGASRISAYRLLPDGARFSTPVTLTFAYTDEEVGNSDPQGLGIAYQDANGVWRAMLASTVNTAARTVSVATTHFTDFTKSMFWAIVPANAIVKTQERLVIKVWSCPSERAVNSANDPSVVFTGGDGDDLTLPTHLPVCEEPPSKWNGSWAVNNVIGGNNSVGTIAPGSPASEATYTAPANQPSPNTVSVTATFNWSTRGKMILISQVTVGGPEVHVVGTYAGEEIIGSFHILSTITDRVEFDLAVTAELVRSSGVINTASKHEGDHLKQPSDACGFQITGTHEFATVTDVASNLTLTREVQTTLDGRTEYPTHTLRFPSLSGCDQSREVPADTGSMIPVTFVFDPAKLVSVGSSLQVRGLPDAGGFVQPENWTFTVTRTK
jgi:hypothetical protein